MTIARLCMPALRQNRAKRSGKVLVIIFLVHKKVEVHAAEQEKLTRMGKPLVVNWAN